MAREQAIRRREENEIEFGRIVAFSDGVFSIAITLLVLNLGIDKGLSSGELTTALLNQWDDLLAFALSFAVIGRFWVVHHRFFAEVDAFDGRLLGLNLLYLAAVVLIPFSSEVLGEYGGRDALRRPLLGQPRGSRPDRPRDGHRRAAPRPHLDR